MPAVSSTIRDREHQTQLGSFLLLYGHRQCEAVNGSIRPHKICSEVPPAAIDVTMPSATGTVSGNTMMEP